jgi:hypothetical protein
MIEVLSSESRKGFLRLTAVCAEKFQCTGQILLIRRKKDYFTIFSGKLEKFH